MTIFRVKTHKTISITEPFHITVNYRGAFLNLFILHIFIKSDAGGVNINEAGGASWLWAGTEGCVYYALQCWDFSWFVGFVKQEEFEFG